MATWDALALDGPGDDGRWLVTWLGQSLAQFLHAMPIHNDGIPTAHTHRDITSEFPTYEGRCINGYYFSPSSISSSHTRG